MTTLTVRQVSSVSKLVVLKEFGHRIFHEVDKDGAPINYFVEVAAATEPEQSGRGPYKKQRERVPNNAILQWSSKPIHYSHGLILKAAPLAQSCTSSPCFRYILRDFLVAELAIGEREAQNLISRFISDDFLRVVEKSYEQR